MFSSFRRHAGSTIALMFLCLLGLTRPVWAESSGPAKFHVPSAAFTVTNINDSGPGSLRDTIDSASSGGFILFDPALTGQTITLTTGEIVIDKDLIITGIGVSGITISGNGVSRIFHITRGDLILSNLTLTRGNATGNGGAVYAASGLQIFSSSIMNSTASGSGGGLYVSGTVRMINTQILSNTAMNDGGGVYAGGADLTDSVIRANYSLARGGGLNTSGYLVMTDTEILSNTAMYYGGGAYAINSDLRGGVFQNNISTYGSGGGLHTVHLLMIDTQFLSNAGYLRFGGAVTQDAHISGGVFRHNRCTSHNCDGGGLAAFDEVVMTDTQFISNTSTGFGGGASFWDDAYLTNVAFHNNQCTATCCGGGVYLSGFNNVLTNVLLADNDSGWDGGGICSEGLITSLTTLVNSTLRNNTASNFGGGVYNRVRVLVEHSTLNGNFAGSSGGGIYSNNALTISHSTLSSNSATVGGGIYSLGDFYDDNLVTIDYSTLTGNAANDGGGIYNDSSYGTYATVNLHRNIIAGNSAADSGSEVYNSGTVTAADYNVIGYGGSPRSSGFTPSGTDIVPVGDLNAVLDSTLQDNGGPTLTHALISGSPAVDAVPIDGSNCNPPVTIDQRGAVRADSSNRGGTACDSGAYEYDSAQTPTAISLQFLTASSTASFSGWLAVGGLAILGAAILIRRKS